MDLAMTGGSAVEESEGNELGSRPIGARLRVARGLRIGIGCEPLGPSGARELRPPPRPPLRPPLSGAKAPIPSRGGRPAALWWPRGIASALASFTSFPALLSPA